MGNQMEYSKEQSQRSAESQRVRCVLEMVCNAATEIVPKQPVEVYSLDLAGFIFKICLSSYMILQVFKNQNHLC